MPVTVADIQNRRAKVAVVGLGYVGLPLAVAFGKKADVIGFDIAAGKIERLRQGEDVTGELSTSELAATTVDYTSDPARLREALFLIVTVPTPVDGNNRPDLGPIESASRLIGKNLSPGAIVVYESTVYPGVTEDVCIGILEAQSGLRCGRDFSVGYSPERINPGDKVHTIDKITKIVSGFDAQTLDTVAGTYELIVDAGVHRAQNIKVAETAKVLENTQRDINIALMNELAIICNKLGIETGAVLDAAGTKWNFLPFRPGLVGGHCIGVDPYYLTHKAQAMGYHPEVILSGRRINDSMGKYVAENAVKQMIKAGKAVLGSRVLVLGLTFKENVKDLRNSKVADIIRELKEFGAEVFVNDPMAVPSDAVREYGIELCGLEKAVGMDAVIFAVAHDSYRNLTVADLVGMTGGVSNKGVVVDVKSRFERSEVEKSGLIYWGL